MKYIPSNFSASIFSGWLALCGLMLMPQFSHAQPQLIDRVVAVIDNEIILQSQLNSKIGEQIAQMRTQNLGIPNREDLAQKVLDSMILETVQLNRAQQLGVQVADEEVNQQLQKIAQQNGMNVLQMQTQLNTESADGFRQFRQQIQRQLVIQKLREIEVISRTQVTESEINNYLQRQNLQSTELNLKHILIALPESPSQQQREQALTQANELRNQALTGESFSQLAVRFSDGGKALQGGNLGWMSPNQVPTFLNDAVAQLETGEISEVIQSPSGFHLVQLAATRNASDQKEAQFRLHQFVILSDNIAGQAPPKSLVTLTESIKSRADFDALQQKFSDIPEEVNRNSDLGWLSAPQIPQGLRDTIQTLPKNTAIGPFANEQGWLIVFLENKRLFSKNEQLQQQQATQAVRMRKANEMFDVWLRRLKDEAYIRIQLDTNT